MVHTKKRNHLKQKTMNDVVFVMTNSRLAEKKHRKPVEYNFDDLESDDDWIVENEEDLEDVEVDQFDLNGPIEEDLNEVEEREPINLNDLDIPDCVDELVGEGAEEDIAWEPINLNDFI
ncbi:hypothetical protein QN277_000946 [Acacia crassicarpa]|nr:hypothetical protein QN277_000946 [Acacia crassicarpa]